MKRDIGTFLLFLLLATLLWYGHAMQSVRNTRVPVYIQYTGKPGVIALGGEGLPGSVQIEVRDAGSRLNTYYREPLHLTIDLRPYIHGEQGTIHVTSDALRRSISDILQGTSQLIETHPESLTCSYYTEREKTVPVVFAGTITPANEYQLSDAPQLNARSVKIFGQEKQLATIDTIYTEAVDITELSDTTTIRVALAHPANVRTEMDSLSLRVNIERFTEKKFMVPIQVIGAPEGYTMRLFPHEVEVNVRVSINHFAKVQPSDVRVTCTYSPERKETMDVEIRTSNSYITDVWAYPGVVKNEKNSNG